MAAQTTSGLTNEMMTFYERTFLDRAEEMRMYEQGGQKKTHGKNNGTTINFTRYSPLSKATTPLTEGSNPAEVNISGATVSAVLQEYGTTVKISKLLSLTSIDRNAEEKIELVGQNMGETMDELARDELYSGATAQLAGSVAAVSSLASSDVMNAAETKRAVRTLEANKAMRYSDGFFLGKITPWSKYDLVSDSTWINAKTYSDVKDLYKGEVGELYGVRFILGTNAKTETSGSVTAYSNFIHGDNAFGVLNLAGDKPKLYIKQPGDGDTSNPADRYSTIAWAGSYVCKTLNSDWLINVKTQVSS